MMSDEAPDDDASLAALSTHGTSPLWMVSHAPALNELVGALQKFRHTLDESDKTERLLFSKARIAAARAEFSEMIRRGERDLHMLAGAVARRLLGAFHMRSVVIGEIEKTHERFTLSVDVSEADVIGTTDLDLGNRVLARLAIASTGVEQRGTWLRAGLISNVVEYEAEAPNDLNVYRILTRIKAEEEIWNKVADEIFELDSIVLKDKQLRHLGRYVKDVFGIKIVVGTSDDAWAVHRSLEGVALEGRALELVEVKDYLTKPSRKQTGWSAIKSVVRWGERTFEIQVQPLSNFLHERERLTKESHASFKTTRERVRDGVAARLPLFAFYRALLRWLFLDSTSEPPLHEGVEIVLTE
jgi:hypothetical protein